MQNPIQNLDKALLFLRNRVFCLKLWKFWRAPTTLQFNIFCWNFALVFYLSLSTKVCVGFFLFCLDFELFGKNKKKTWFQHTCFFTFINKPRTLFCRHYLVENVCKISAKNIKFYGSWSSLKFFNISDKKPGFLEIIEVYLNLDIRFCITCLVLPNY